MNEDTSPTATSVYLYYDEFDALIYVGITSRGVTRQAEHNKTKPWWQHVQRQDVEHYPTRDAALARESELIRDHLPPFNTQQNPLHQAMRSSYLAARAILEAEVDPLQLARQHGYHMPLGIVEHAGRRLVLLTPVAFAPIVHRTQYEHPKAIVGSTKCGALVSAERRGLLLLLEFNVRAGINVGEPFARMKAMTTAAGPRFEIRNVQLSS